MTIFLIGYMGSGKSTLGKTLAGRLRASFADMDRAIEAQAGMSVAEIFAERGEAFFRQMEREFLAAQGQSEGLHIVATGGGAACQPGNMELMNRVGRSVYLKMSPAQLVGRLSAAGREKRPLIRGMNDAQLLDFIATNLAAREPFYEQAQLVIDCGGVSDEYIVRHIEMWMENS